MMPWKASTVTDERNDGEAKPQAAWKSLLPSASCWLRIVVWARWNTRSSHATGSLSVGSGSVSSGLGSVASGAVGAGLSGASVGDGELGACPVVVCVAQPASRSAAAASPAMITFMRGRYVTSARTTGRLLLFRRGWLAARSG